MSNNTINTAQIRTAHVLARALGHRWALELTADEAVAAGSPAAIFGLVEDRRYRTAEEEARRDLTEEGLLPDERGPAAEASTLRQRTERILEEDLHPGILAPVLQRDAPSLGVRWPAREPTDIVHASGSGSVRYSVCGDGSVAIRLAPSDRPGTRRAVGELLAALIDQGIVGMVEFARAPAVEVVGEVEDVGPPAHVALPRRHPAGRLAD